MDEIELVLWQSFQIMLGYATISKEVSEDNWHNGVAEVVLAINLLGR